MPITIPDPTQIRITTKFEVPMFSHAMPAAILDTAMTNPGPVAVSPSGSVGDAANQARVTPAIGAAGAAGYIGYMPDPNQIVGAAVSAVRNVIIDGFAGVTPGAPVYVDATGADVSTTTSGLTHTPQSGAGTQSAEIDAGTVSATSTIEIVVPAGATTLTGLDFTTNTTVAADDTNFWTEALTNLGLAGSGSTVMLAAADTNTSKATGGNGGYTAGVPTAAVLSATPANLTVAAGQVLKLVMTKAASAPNLVDLTIRATFGGSTGGQGKIGIGYTTTKIYFL